MKPLRTIFLFFLCLIALPTHAQELLMQLDRHHSSLGFEVDYLGLMKQRGSFNKFDCVLRYDEKQAIPLLSFSLVVDVRSIDTNNRIRDNHLKSPDFLASDSIPFAVFQSTTVEQINKNEFRIKGQLTLKGIKKELTFVVTRLYNLTNDREKNLRLGFVGQVSISRQDFNILGGNQHNGRFNLREQIIGNEIKLDFSIQHQRQNATDWQPALSMLKEHQRLGSRQLLEKYRVAVNTVNSKVRQATDEQVEQVVSIIEVANILTFRQKYAEAQVLLSAFDNLSNLLTKKAHKVQLEALHGLGNREELLKKANQVLQQSPGDATALELLRN